MLELAQQIVDDVIWYHNQIIIHRIAPVNRYYNEELEKFVYFNRATYGFSKEDEQEFSDAELTMLEKLLNDLYNNLNAEIKNSIHVQRSRINGVPENYVQG